MHLDLVETELVIVSALEGSAEGFALVEMDGWMDGSVVVQKL